MCEGIDIIVPAFEYLAKLSDCVSSLTSETDKKVVFHVLGKSSLGLGVDFNIFDGACGTVNDRDGD